MPITDYSNGKNRVDCNGYICFESQYIAKGKKSNSGSYNNWNVCIKIANNYLPYKCSTVAETIKCTPETIVFKIITRQWEWRTESCKSIHLLKMIIITPKLNLEEHTSDHYRRRDMSQRGSIAW